MAGFVSISVFPACPVASFLFLGMSVNRLPVYIRLFLQAVNLPQDLLRHITGGSTPMSRMTSTKAYPVPFGVTLIFLTVCERRRAICWCSKVGGVTHWVYLIKFHCA
ncbi:MAG TPA: hypothetical protein PK528_00055 [Syntrophorhabdus sp.]|nr:hypothetical protein [Syntrophorhabdus sp.]